jgi:hypothetical protein
MERTGDHTIFLMLSFFMTRIRSHKDAKYAAQPRSSVGYCA